MRAALGFGDMAVMGIADCLNLPNVFKRSRVFDRVPAAFADRKPRGPNLKSMRAFAAGINIWSAYA